jgi:tetratricopeptide (TPR) repeat protein
MTRALTLAEGLGDRNPRLAQLHIGMTRLLDRRRDFDRALQHAEQADAILKAEHGENATERLGALEAVGQVCMDAGWAERAIPPLELALSIQGSANADALSLAIGRGKPAEANARAGRVDIALRLYDQAWRPFADDPSLREDAFYPELQLRRGEALMAARRGAEAVDALRAAVVWWAERQNNPERLAIARWSLAQAQCPSDAGRKDAELALAYYESLDSEFAVRKRKTISAWLANGCPPTD